MVLASSSPRRRALLKLIVDDFEVIPPRVSEVPPSHPQDLLRTAGEKVRAVRSLRPGALVIGADTGVFLGEKHFGKPKNQEEAREMLRALSGRWHTVATGLVVQGPGGRESALVTTQVRFARLSPEEIEWYLAGEEVLDKAGAYGIQGRAGVFVEEIRGDFFNVVGLPLRVTYRLLRKLGWPPGRA